MRATKSHEKVTRKNVPSDEKSSESECSNGNIKKISARLEGNLGRSGSREQANRALVISGFSQGHF